ncbi:cyclic nucleotide-binding domain-containing protein [Capnocytophaga catalasegens]|nr:cyclic nucleotide-binding domain-containing protein [Capnocytophaga catalasegens]
MDWGNTLQTKYNTWEENDALLLEKLTTFKTFRKGEIIIKEGTNDKYIYFLTKGFARGFPTRRRLLFCRSRMSADGREVHQIHLRSPDRCGGELHFVQTIGDRRPYQHLRF